MFRRRKFDTAPVGQKRSTGFMVAIDPHAVDDLTRRGFPWWGRRDSNPHGLSHMLLRHARLPFRHSPARSMVLSDADSTGIKRLCKHELRSGSHVSRISEQYLVDGDFDALGGWAVGSPFVAKDVSRLIHG